MVTPLVLSSGACALVYEVTWLREFRLLFGASTLASATVLALFIAGVGLGSRLLGARVDRHRDPLAFYLWLEVGIALCAALTPFWLSLARFIYLGLGGSTTLGNAGATVVRLLLAAPILLPPTLLMGGTLPAVARAAEADRSPGRHMTALLYGVNTLGAVVGASATTFFLLESFGNRKTIWLAVSINLLVVLLGFALRRFGLAPAPADIASLTSEPGSAKLDASEQPPSAPPPSESGASEPLASEPLASEQRPSEQRPSEQPPSEASASRKGASKPPASKQRSSAVPEGTPLAAMAAPVAAPRRLLLGLSAASGFTFFLMELVYYRMLAPILGGSVFTLGLILAVALAGVGVGGLIYAARAALFEARLRTLVWSFFLQAVGLSVPYLMGDSVALFAAHSQPGAEGSFGARVTGWVWVAGLVVLPSALVAGFQFPLIVALSGRGREGLGKQTGDVYAWNTVGAVLGSLVGGFGVMSLLGAPGTWRLACLLLVGLSVTVAFFVPRTQGKGLGIRQLALGTVLAALLFSAQGPTAGWRHSGIGVGRFSLKQLEQKNGTRDFLHRHRRAKIWDRDGVESSVALTSQQGLVFVVNGKIDGHSTLDAPTAVMSGLLGALLHPNPQSSLVIGLGTGSTAGWLAKVPSMKKVDVFELEAAVLDVARDCHAVNHDALHNPKLKVTIGDGRELLLTSREKYDVIFSEPSNPYRAGIASLFTREFYQAIKQRLNPGGVFLQWVQVYEVDRQAIDLVYATLGSEFAHIESWRTHRDLLLIATNEPLNYDAERLQKSIASEPYKQGLLVSWKVAELEGMFARYVARPEYARQVIAKHRGPLNTDDQNLLEFGFARSVNRHDLFSMKQALELSRKSGFDRPPVAADLDWETVEHGRSLLYGNPLPRGELPAGEPLKLYAVLFDRLLRAAASGRPLPPELLERLGEIAPEGVDIVQASLAYRAHEPELAVEHLTRAFDRLHESPWPDADLMFTGMKMIGQIGLQDRRLVDRILAVLKDPFASRVLDEQRADIGFQIATHHRMPTECVHFLSSLEPWPPWREKLLELRVTCYEIANSPKLNQAREDLAEFVADE